MSTQPDPLGGPDPLRPATPPPHLDKAERLRRMARLERLSRQMDSAIRLPIVGVRLGWDSILGLVPGIGDALALAPGAWIVLESHRMGAPRHLLARQAANVAIDTAIGTIPVIGDLFDIGFKANRRNVDMLKRHFERLDSTGDDRLS